MVKSTKQQTIFNIGIMIICVIAFLNVLAPAFIKKPKSDTPFDQVVQKTLEGIDMTNYPSQDVQSVRRFFQLDPQHFDQIAFYRTNDAMSADELLIVQFSDPKSADQFKDCVEKRIQDQINVYSGYAPEQENIMKNAIVDIYQNYALYVSGPQADQIEQNFINAL